MTTQKSVRLCIKSNVSVFASLVKGDSDAPAKIAQLATAGKCNFVGIPKGVSDAVVAEIQQLVGSDVTVQPVNFQVSENSGGHRQQEGNFLHPKTCALTFARLAKGDEGAATTIALRAIQNDCNIIGVPDNLSTQALNLLEDACAAQNVKTKYIRFTLSDGVLAKAERDMQYEARSADKTGYRSSGRSMEQRLNAMNGANLKQDNSAKDPSRRKAHANKRSIAEQQRRKKERAALDRARCNGGKKEK